MWYWDTMFSTQGQCRGCPFWCSGAQKEATWRGGHAKQKRNLAFSGDNWVDEMDWNFYRRILTPWPTITTGIHSPGPLAPCAGMQKPRVQVERLLRCVKLQRLMSKGTCERLQILVSSQWLDDLFVLLKHRASGTTLEPTPEVFSRPQLWTVGVGRWVLAALGMNAMCPSLYTLRVAFAFWFVARSGQNQYMPSASYPSDRDTRLFDALLTVYLTIDGHFSRTKIWLLYYSPVWDCCPHHELFLKRFLALESDVLEYVTLVTAPGVEALASWLPVMWNGKCDLSSITTEVNPDAGMKQRHKMRHAFLALCSWVPLYFGVFDHFL